MRLILGCGYLGERVARLWQLSGDNITIVTRGASRGDEFRRRELSTIVADIERPEELTKLPAAETVLFAVGFDRSVGQSIQQVYEGGLRNVLAALPAETGRVIYISTTGVYGKGDGEWVDEQTPPDPQRDGGRASLAAEQVLAAHQHGQNAVILRMAGLYGTRRIPFLDLLRAGQSVPVAGNGHLNLIHVDDAARIILAAADAPTFHDGPRVYCVSDGHPVLREEYYRAVAREINAPPPTFVTPEPNSPRAGRAEVDRRVRNQKMLDELQVSLMYPDYRAGLAAILAAE